MSKLDLQEPCETNIKLYFYFKLSLYFYFKLSLKQIKWKLKEYTTTNLIYCIFFTKWLTYVPHASICKAHFRIRKD
jgi:hypothetical protein